MLLLPIIVAASLIYVNDKKLAKEVKKEVQLPLSEASNERLPSDPQEVKGSLSQRIADEVQKTKRLIDDRKTSRKVLPWEKSDEVIEQFSANLWKSQRVKYVELFKSWSFSEQAIAKMEDIILHRDTETRKLAKQLDEVGSMTPESEKLAAKKRELKVQANDQLRIILGSDKLSEFEAWEKNKRMQSLNSVFDAAR